MDGVVFAALDLNWLDTFASRLGLPDGSTLLVLDRDGTVLARFPDGKRWVGASARETPLVQEIVRGGGEGVEGVFEGPGLDGTQRLYGYTVLPGPTGAPDLYVSVGTPAALAYFQLDESFNRKLVLLLLAAIAVLLLAFLGSEFFIMRVIRRLMSTLSRITAGDLLARTGVPYREGELGRLAQAVDVVATSLAWEREEKQRQEELRRKNYELEQQMEASEEANRQKDEFVSTVSHELRVPLTSIKGYVELLLEGSTGKLTDQQEQFLGVAHSNSERLLVIINDLLEVSRMEAGHIDLRLQAIDLGGSSGMWSNLFAHKLSTRASG